MKLNINTNAIIQKLGPKLLPAIAGPYLAQYGIDAGDLAGLLGDAPTPGGIDMPPAGTGYGKYWRERAQRKVNDNDVAQAVDMILQDPRFEDLAIAFGDLLYLAIDARRQAPPQAPIQEGQLG